MATPPKPSGQDKPPVQDKLPVQSQFMPDNIKKIFFEELYKGVGVPCDSMYDALTVRQYEYVDDSINAEDLSDMSELERAPKLTHTTRHRRKADQHRTIWDMLMQSDANFNLKLFIFFIIIVSFLTLAASLYWGSLASARLAELKMVLRKGDYVCHFEWTAWSMCSQTCRQPNGSLPMKTRRTHNFIMPRGIYKTPETTKMCEEAKSMIDTAPCNIGDCPKEVKLDALGRSSTCQVFKDQCLSFLLPRKNESYYINYLVDLRPMKRVMWDPSLLTEEISLGFHLKEHPPCFNRTNQKFAIISRKYVIVYDIKTGHRLNVFHHTSNIVGLKWMKDSLVAIAENRETFWWNLEENNLKKSGRIEGKEKFLYTYINKKKVFAVTEKVKNVQKLVEINLKEESIEMVLTLPSTIKKRSELAVENDFAVLCCGRLVKVIFFIAPSTKLETEFHFGQHFTGADYNDKVAFESVKVVNNNVFAVLTIGRVYSWQKVNELGLVNANRTFFHSHNAEVTIAVTSFLAVFCGTGNCRVDKWNLLTSGRGKYEQFHAMERMDAPVEALWLSPGDDLLLAVLADNSLIMLNTASLAVISRPQTVQCPSLNPADWLQIKSDVENPNYIVSNGRHGYIQWIDPVKWRTISEFDISKENAPPNDCPTIPDYNWTNVYSLAISSSLIVSGESKRFNVDKTTLKFFTRLSARSINDIKFINGIDLDYKVKFIRLSLEETKHSMDVKMAERQYVIVVDYDGNISAFHPDSYRHRRWCLDITRQTKWHNTKIIDCSTIRDDVFVTVNQSQVDDNDETFVVIWDSSTFRVIGCLDQIPGVRNVAWSPSSHPGQLLISGDFGILAYDTINQTFNWVIQTSGLKLFSNKKIVFAYNDKEVIQFNPQTGRLINKALFTLPQDNIIATGHAENVRFSGINSDGLSLLKPETEENETLREITVDMKKTPFSVLAQVARSKQTEQSLKKLTTLNKASARKLLEGTAYTLAPITKLGPSFVESCLIPREIE